MNVKHGWIEAEENKIQRKTTSNSGNCKFAGMA